MCKKGNTLSPTLFNNLDMQTICNNVSIWDLTMETEDMPSGICFTLYQIILVQIMKFLHTKQK